MKTRSQTNEYTVDIDFDAASAAWKTNKILQGNGSYTYRCMAIVKSGEPCCQTRYQTNEYCRRHLYKK